MVRIRIDQQHYEVPEGKNVLEACLELGFDLPYFCWHPALGSVGACRQCAVKQFKDEKDTRGKLVMSCMTPARDGIIVSISDAEARRFRAASIEWLMVNHPHDCPVCDEGGECHLQDMTLLTGHAYRRFRFKKRTFRNQDLGPFVNHEMNRCIACYRCVRFYRDFAGGRDFNVFAAHDHVYFGRHEDGVLESEFSGNLIEVCPTGVFTDKTLKKHYTRKWDLQTAPSVCAHCSLGCNTLPGERYGKLRRILNRYHPSINGYFLCDRGRFGYEFVNGERRLRDAWLRPSRDASVTKADKNKILAELGSLLVDPAERERAIGIGSPRASLESNFALRYLVGKDRFFSGISLVETKLLSDALTILQSGPVSSASLKDVERADAVVILGEDVTNTAPRLALSLRQSVKNAPMEISRKLKIPDWQDASVRDAIQESKGPVFIATPYQTRLDEIATRIHYSAPDEIARLGFALAHALDSEAPAVADLSPEARDWVRAATTALKAAKRPVVITGMGCRSTAVLQASANVASALHKQNAATRICLALPEANSLGVAFLGGKNLDEAFAAMSSGQVDTVIILENDLFRRGSSDAVREFLGRARRVILLDHTATAMIPRTDVLLPTTSFAESSGTWINHEGRAQRFFSVFKPDLEVDEGPVQESWRWLRDLGMVAGLDETQSWSNLDDVLAALARYFPALGRVREAAPSADFRIHGSKIPRQPHRYSGRTAMVANRRIYEPEPPCDPDSPLAFSMEGAEEQPPPPLITRYWAPGWNSAQAVNKFQSEIGGALCGDRVGVRLIEPDSRAVTKYFQNVPHAFEPRSESWLALPIYHIFGSEELSVLSPGVSQLTPKPYVAIHPSDGSRLGVNAGDELTLKHLNRTRSFPVRIEGSLPVGTIGLPVGLPGMDGFDVGLPAWYGLSVQQARGAA